MIYWIYTLQKIAHYLANCGPRRKLVIGSVFLFSSIAVLASISHAPTVIPAKQQAGELALDLPSSILTLHPAELIDLDEIRRGGQLRVLHLARGEISLNERSLLQRYVTEQGLTLKWITATDEKRLFDYLKQGRADVALSQGLEIPQRLSETLKLSLPWGVSQQQVISRSDTGRIRSRGDLSTRQVALKASSPMWQSLQVQAAESPAMSILEIPEMEAAENILRKVASGQYDVTILDNLTAEELLPSFLNLEVAFNASEARVSSWALRSSSAELAASLDAFLNKQYLHSQIARSYQEDLPGLQKKKVLRLITYKGPVNYYLKGGKLKGFEHDLLKRFAESHEMRLDVVVADSHEEMQHLLVEGKGDVIAASVPQNAWAGETGIAYTGSYSHSAPVVIGRSKDTMLLDAGALSGRQLVLAASSPYRKMLERMQAQGVDLELKIAPVEQSLEQVLFHIASGVYDLTLLGGHELKAQFARQVNIRAHFSLAEPLPQVWAVREDDRLLLGALNEYIGKEFRKGFYNVLYSKYIETPRPILGDTQLLAASEKLSPYDDIVHKYAEHYGFDWRLIVAQMYQESQFNPRAVSYAGAQGLMQLIPDTADLLGIEDSYDPDSSIQAGIRYMDYLRGKFKDNELLEERIWFSLAAYNAGFNRVQRARRLAERMNLDKNKWFDNVEKAMLAMARPYWKDGEVARNCRCGQAVVYVREIRTLYNNYVHLRPGIRTVAKNREFIGDI